MNTADKNRAYYLAHREELGQKRRARYAADPDRHKAANKRWRVANAEQLRDYMTVWKDAHADHLTEYRKAYYVANREKMLARSRRDGRKHSLKRDYGMTPDDYRDMLVGQAGRCLICLRVPERKPGLDMAVDHDHATGRVRGLLCNPCNRLLGLAHDDPKLLASAVRYLGAA